MSRIRKTSVAQSVVEAFQAEKVEFVFGLAGSHVLPIYDALADVPEIQHVVVKHENNAAFMAGMVGYLTGRPGVALVTAGPGATNSLSGVVQAYAQSVPMVHISGDVPLGSGNDAFHGVDREDFLHKMFTDVTKWSVRVQRAEDIPEILSRAFALAASGRPGPVHVDIPENIVQATEVDLPPYSPSPVTRQEPPDGLVDQVRQALKKAQRPMICAGRGVLVHRAETELIALAETLSAPVCYSMSGLGSIAQGHPLAAGALSEWRGDPFVFELMAEADLLLAVGLRTGTRTTDMLIEQGCRNIIFVALDEPHTLTPMDGIETLAAADSQLFLSQLLAHADEFSRPADTALRQRIAQHQQAFERGLAQHLASFQAEQPLHFGCVVQELSARLGEDAIVVGGVGTHNMWGEMLTTVHNRESCIQEGPWATMGSELAGGIAAKLVYPERKVVVVTGDGSLLMSGSDFVTAVETGANVLVVVLNDSRYGMITVLQRQRFGRSFGDEIGWIDFARFAESFGATGIRVESPEALSDAVAQAVAATTNGPVLLDAVCNHKFGWPAREAIKTLGMAKGASEK